MSVMATRDGDAGTVMETRDGDAGTVCAAASRAHCLGPQLSFGVWRENT